MVEAKEWFKQYETMEDAWKKCHRADWMVHFIAIEEPGVAESEQRQKLVDMCNEITDMAHSAAGTDRAVLLVQAAVFASTVLLKTEHPEKKAVAAVLFAAEAVATERAGRKESVIMHQLDKEKFLREAAEVVRQHYPDAPRMK